MFPDVLFTPVTFGSISMPNQIVMPALTRMRAASAGVPQAIAAQYYAQRASAGLIITEATAISVPAHGFPQMPCVQSTRFS